MYLMSNNSSFILSFVFVFLFFFFQHILTPIYGQVIMEEYPHTPINWPKLSLGHPAQFWDGWLLRYCRHVFQTKQNLINKNVFFSSQASFCPFFSISFPSFLLFFFSVFLSSTKLNVTIATKFPITFEWEQTVLRIITYNHHPH